MALLVKFAIVRQVLLRPQAQQLTVAQNGGAIVQLAVMGNWQAHQRHQVQPAACLQDGSQAVFGTLQQGLLQKQVAAGVAGQAKFRKADQLHALGRVHAHGVNDLLGIIGAVGHMQGGGGGGCADKSIFKSGKAVLHSPNFLFIK